MSRPSNDYYGYMKMRIRKYPKIKEENKTVSLLQAQAIEREIAKYKSDDNPDKFKAVEMVLLKNEYTVQGAALKLNYSYDTVKRWISVFVNDVGRMSGF